MLVWPTRGGAYEATFEGSVRTPCRYGGLELGGVGGKAFMANGSEKTVFCGSGSNRGDCPASESLSDDASRAIKPAPLAIRRCCIAPRSRSPFGIDLVVRLLPLAKDADGIVCFTPRTRARAVTLNED